MSNYLDIQKDILEEVKSKSNGKLVDVLIETLSISSDSAYRRIRLEKIFTLDELLKLSETFNISIDQHLTNKSAESVLFTFPFKTSNFDVFEYFEKILEHLIEIKEANGVLYYSAKDIPIFHFFQDKELLAFKFHYWFNTMNNGSELLKGDFSFDYIPAKLAELTKRIYSLYSSIETHEIWNYETFTRTSTQITYYYELGILNQKQAELLQDKLLDFANHLEKECQLGSKFFMNNNPINDDYNYKFYYNEILAADNSIYAEYGEKKGSFLPHIVLNYMSTDNEQYSLFNKSIFENVINKSTLISKVNEKDRKKFFNFNKKFVERQKLKIDII